MKIISKILIGLAVVGLLSATIAPQVSEIRWVNARKVESYNSIKITSSQILNGDSIVLYKGGNRKYLDAMYIESVPYLGGYNTEGSTDTVKIYATFEGTPVEIGYLTDTVFGNDIYSLHKVNSSIGNIDGTLYYMIIPAGKFTEKVGGSDGYENLTNRFLEIK